MVDGVAQDQIAKVAEIYQLAYDTDTQKNHLKDAIGKHIYKFAKELERFHEADKKGTQLQNLIKTDQNQNKEISAIKKQVATIGSKK